MNNLGSLQQPAGLGQHQMPRQQPFQQSTGPTALAANDRPIISQNNIEDDSDSESKPEKRSGRRKIKIEFIEDKSRRHITFSKRKAGIMKKVTLQPLVCSFDDQHSSFFIVYRLMS